MHLNYKIQLEVNNKITEQLISFNFLGNMTSCESEVEIDKKLNNYLKTTGISNMLRRHKPLMKTRMKLHNTLAMLYSSENSTIKSRDERRITAAGMKCLRKTAGCTWTNYKKHKGLKINKYDPRFLQNIEIQKNLFTTK
jgi:hypothetical protein